MSAIVLKGRSLGSVIRSYEDPKVYRRSYKPLPKPQHRHDDACPHMRPDANDTLEVLAECERHYARLSRADVRNGVVAPCPHSQNPCLKVWYP